MQLKLREQFSIQILSYHFIHFPQHDFLGGIYVYSSDGLFNLGFIGILVEGIWSLLFAVFAALIVEVLPWSIAAI